MTVISSPCFRGKLAAASLGLAVAACGWQLLPRRAEESLIATTPVLPPIPSIEHVLANPDFIPSHRHPLLDRQAPEFRLADSGGRVWSLSELCADGPVVVVFHHDDCAQCSRQVFDTRRALPAFCALGAGIVAIGAAPSESTGFPILADPENRTARAYRLDRRLGGAESARLLHGTFLVDRHGIIRWVNVGDAPFRRTSALLSQIARIEGRVGSPSQQEASR
jgi:peroxiredoxin